MSPGIRAFGEADLSACLALFDANCPRFFAPNERAEFVAYLRAHAGAYRLYERGGRVIAAFGVALRGDRARLNWIMVDPEAQGSGAGGAMIAATIASARAGGARVIDIAASHLSEPFFARHGARARGRIADGWGPGMHRVDMELSLD
ncbi:MAG: GNAT family N-acetyltransferase [Sphingomonas sp.]|uniref:GNAT family N-acetyltransferase n=1 Tax=Sphingomonas sp. TaxID=28214 RepID=UPI0025E93C51|nr:GNAT family N-acetyltransferase [Sphingomonas sp.]MBQ1500741.1 GNAT family N-acetyltransferase [Sphingomonas sp.]